MDTRIGESRPRIEEAYLLPPSPDVAGMHGAVSDGHAAELAVPLAGVALNGHAGYSDGSAVWSEEAYDRGGADVQTPVGGEPSDDIESLNLLRTYLDQAGKTPLLNAEQEVILAKRIEAGVFASERLRVNTMHDGSPIPIDSPLQQDLLWIKRDGERAKDHFLGANLRLVVSIARRYTGRGVLPLDLIQEGNLGLIRAVEKFDHTKGYKFSTYATRWIMQSISRGIADQARTIHIPRNVVEEIDGLVKIRDTLVQVLGREPTTEELAEQMSVTPQKIQDLQQNAEKPLSLQLPVGFAGTELGDIITDIDQAAVPDMVAAIQSRDLLDRVLKTLTEREADIIRALYGLDDGEPKSLRQLAKKYSITHQSLGQSVARIMAKLRDPSRSEVLSEQA